MNVRTLFLAALLCAGLAEARPASDDDEAPPPPRTSKPVPALRKAPKVDGDLRDLKAGMTLSPADGEAWRGSVGYRNSALHLGVQVTDDKVVSGDLLEVSIFFPGAGTTARGYTWRFAVDGLRGSADVPGFAQKLTEARVEKTDGGFIVEATFPARALPRFPAKDPMVMDLCITYEDREEPADTPVRSTNCLGGTMVGDALRLPDAFRSSLKLRPPQEVVGLEGRAEGWVGYAILHYPVWVSSDVPLTAQILRSLVADPPVDPKKAGIHLPDALLLPDGRTVLSVLSGADPYAVEGQCDADKELRVGLYLVQGRTAGRVLEWPASTCALGRAVAFELDEEGELTMGYTNGATVTFLWSKDHFERTEIGSR